MYCTMVAINVKNGACHRYYTLNARSDFLNVHVLFRVPDRNLDLLMCFVFYVFALRMDTGTVLTAVAIYPCKEIDKEKTALRNGIVLYYFQRGEMFQLEEGSVLANKRSQTRSTTLTLVSLPKMSIVYHIRLFWVTLESIRRSSDEYYGVPGISNDTDEKRGLISSI